MVEITTTFKFLTMIITLALVITIFAAGKDIIYKWFGKPDEDMFFTLSPKYKGTVELACTQAATDATTPGLSPGDRDYCKNKIKYGQGPCGNNEGGCENNNDCDQEFRYYGEKLECKQLENTNGVCCTESIADFICKNGYEDFLKTARPIIPHSGIFKYEIKITNLGIVYDKTENVDAIPVVFFKEKIAGGEIVKLEKDGKNVFSMNVIVYSNTEWSTSESFFIGFFKSNDLCKSLSQSGGDKNTFVKQCAKRLIGGVRMNGKCGKEVPIE